ncbi:hypothetical protein HK103_006275 [Boothiomyces macroporosus]|uniref:Uncharacterized protein n=1 Tax=Boothiomyces macroporosus TaxID=261099 RepID=A0AAD5UE04_9FUNG|nr:hypothetical protein HK103_006275 [Boothiomyces macroporosus]
MYMKLNRVVNDWDYTALQLAHLRQYKELERIDWNLVSCKTKSYILQTKLGDEASLMVLQSLDLAQLENRDFVFLRSCFLGYYLSAKYLLQSPLVDPTYARNRAITAAAYNGYLDMLELLLNDSRVDPAVSNNCPIRMAAKNGHLDIVKLLLKDPRVDPSADNQFAVRYASLNKHFKVVKVLLEDPRVQDYGSDNFYSIPGILSFTAKDDLLSAFGKMVGQTPTECIWPILDLRQGESAAIKAYQTSGFKFQFKKIIIPIDRFIALEKDLPPTFELFLINKNELDRLSFNLSKVTGLELQLEFLEQIGLFERKFQLDSLTHIKLQGVMPSGSWDLLSQVLEHSRIEYLAIQLTRHLPLQVFFNKDFSARLKSIKLIGFHGGDFFEDFLLPRFPEKNLFPNLQIIDVGLFQSASLIHLIETLDTTKAFLFTRFYDKLKSGLGELYVDKLPYSDRSNEFRNRIGVYIEQDNWNWLLDETISGRVFNFWEIWFEGSPELAFECFTKCIRDRKNVVNMFARSTPNRTINSAYSLQIKSFTNVILNDGKFLAMLASKRIADDQYLELSNIQLSIEAATLFSESLRTTNFSSLSITHANLSPQILTILQTGIAKSKLAYVDFSFNPDIDVDDILTFAAAVKKSNLSTAKFKGCLMDQTLVDRAVRLLPFSIPKNQKALSHQVEYDSRNVYLSDDLEHGLNYDSGPQTDCFERLKLFKKSVFKFNSFSLEPRAFARLHAHLPSAYTINLKLISDNVSDINWKEIDQSNLQKITNLHITDFYLRNVTDILDLMSGLQSLTVKSESDGAESEFNVGDQTNAAAFDDWQKVFKMMPQLAINRLEILNYSLFNQCTPLFASIVSKTQLTKLSLRKCNVNDDMVAAIAAELPNCLIHSLELEENVVTDRGAKAIAETLPNCNLKILNLSYNRIGVPGLKLLSEQLSQSKLCKFNIMYNNFKEHYFHILIENLPNTKLESFAIHELSKKAEEALINNINRSNLREISIPLSMKNLGKFIVATKGSKLKTIEFEFGDDVDDQIEILGKHLKFSTVETIYLTDNCDDPEIKITNCWSIFEGLDKDSTLTELHISEFEFTDNDIQRISAHLKNTNLNYLGCCCSNLNDSHLINLIPGVIESSIRILDFNFSCNSDITTKGFLRFVDGVKDSLKELKFAPNEWPLPKEDYRALRKILGDNSKLKVTVQKSKEDRMEY